VERKRPYFKVCDIDYAVENNPLWSVGHDTNYFYKSAHEKDVESNKTQESDKKIDDKANSED